MRSSICLLGLVLLAGCSSAAAKANGVLDVVQPCPAHSDRFDGGGVGECMCACGFESDGAGGCRALSVGSHAMTISDSRTGQALCIVFPDGGALER
jgi:hypothetical protein